MKRNVLVSRHAGYHYTRSSLGDLMEAGMTSDDAEFLLLQIANRDDAIKVEMTFVDNAHIARLHANLIANNIVLIVNP